MDTKRQLKEHECSGKLRRNRHKYTAAALTQIASKKQQLLTGKLSIAFHPNDTLSYDLCTWGACILANRQPKLSKLALVYVYPMIVVKAKASHAYSRLKKKLIRVGQNLDMITILHFAIM